MNEKKYPNKEKNILDRIKDIINNNRDFSINVAKVEINSILNENMNIKDSKCNAGSDNNE